MTKELVNEILPCYFSGPFYMVTCEICHDEYVKEVKEVD